MIASLILAGMMAALNYAAAQSSQPQQQASGPAEGTAVSQTERKLARLPKSRREGLLASDGTLPGPDFTRLFDRQVAEIRMRDGVTLHTEIYTPKNPAAALPIIYERTPYGLSPDSHGYSAHLRMYPELIADGYIFAVQDSLGRTVRDGRTHEG
jgi:predicted acyl esterase